MGIQRTITAAEATNGATYHNQRGQPVTCRGKAGSPGYVVLENANGVPLDVPGSYQLTEIAGLDRVVVEVAALDGIVEITRRLLMLSDDQLDELAGATSRMDVMTAIQNELARRDDDGEGDTPPEPEPEPEPEPDQPEEPEPAEAAKPPQSLCPACLQDVILRPSELAADRLVFELHAGLGGNPTECPGSSRDLTDEFFLLFANRPRVIAAYGPNAKAKAKAAEPAQDATAQAAEKLEAEGKASGGAGAWAATERPQRVIALHKNVRSSRASLKLETDTAVINEAIAAEHGGKARGTILKQLGARVVKLGGTPWGPHAQPGGNAEPGFVHATYCNNPNPHEVPLGCAHVLDEPRTSVSRAAADVLLSNGLAEIDADTGELDPTPKGAEVVALLASDEELPPEPGSVECGNCDGNGEDRTGKTCDTCEGTGMVPGEYDAGGGALSRMAHALGYDSDRDRLGGNVVLWEDADRATLFRPGQPVVIGRGVIGRWEGDIVEDYYDAEIIERLDDNAVRIKWQGVHAQFFGQFDVGDGRQLDGTTSDTHHRIAGFADRAVVIYDRAHGQIAHVERVSADDLTATVQQEIANAPAGRLADLAHRVARRWTLNADGREQRAEYRLRDPKRAGYDDGFSGADFVGATFRNDKAALNLYRDGHENGRAELKRVRQEVEVKARAEGQAAFDAAQEAAPQLEPTTDAPEPAALAVEPAANEDEPAGQVAVDVGAIQALLRQFADTLPAFRRQGIHASITVATD